MNWYWIINCLLIQIANKATPDGAARNYRYCYSLALLFRCASISFFSSAGVRLRRLDPDRQLVERRGQLERE
jgi:hypothetical protein